MVTVLKNVTNVITAVGEMYLFQKHHDGRVWAALFLMVRSISQNVSMGDSLVDECFNRDVKQQINLLFRLVINGSLLLPDNSCPVFPFSVFICLIIFPCVLIF